MDYSFNEYKAVQEVDAVHAEVRVGHSRPGQRHQRCRVARRDIGQSHAGRAPEGGGLTGRLFLSALDTRPQAQPKSKRIFFFECRLSTRVTFLNLFPIFFECRVSTRVTFLNLCVALTLLKCCSVP